MRTLAAILAALAAACASPGGAGDDPGHRLFLAKCTSCHVAPEAATHSDHEWSSLVEEYGREAKCTAEEMQLILGYLRRTNGRD